VIFRKTIKILFLYIPIGYIALSLLLVLLFKWAPVYVTPLMAVRKVQNIGEKSYSIKKEWVPMENISANMARAVVAAEDQRFYSHNGFEFEEISKVWQAHKQKGKRLRGCSTISQQTAKNCFTFCSHTWLRKAFESYYTVLIEFIWGKDRILEVYLNVAELGVGIFGVEAACEEYYGHDAHKISRGDAASLACLLPNPLKRTPSWVLKHRKKHRADIIRAMQYVSMEE